MNKKVLYLLSILFISFSLIMNVDAKKIVNVGEIVEEVGEYDSTRFVAGNKVTNKSSNKSISFIAGNEILTEGKSEYGFYAGNILNINDEIEKDLFIAGNSVTITESAILNRDVFIAANSVVIKANIERDLRIGASSVDLRGITINGDAFISAGEILLDEDSVIVGKLTYFEDTRVDGLEKANVGSTLVKKNISIGIEYTLKDRIISFIERALAALIVMLVLFYLIPRSKDKIDNLEYTIGDIFKTMAIGLVTLIVAPIVIIIALLTGILTPLALIMGAIFIISIYLSSLIVSYIIGRLIYSKLFIADNIYISLITGIVLLRLLYLIPYLGAPIVFFVLIYGLGLIFKFIKSRDN